MHENVAVFRVQMWVTVFWWPAGVPITLLQIIYFFKSSWYVGVQC